MAVIATLHFVQSFLELLNKLWKTARLVAASSLYQLFDFSGHVVLLPTNVCNW